MARPGFPAFDLNYTAHAAAEPADRSAAVAAVAAAAQFLRKREPHSPAPYLMLRGLRWGELRASSDPAVLEAPPAEIRRQIRALALKNKWAEAAGNGGECHGIAQRTRLARSATLRGRSLRGVGQRL